ncbi:pseudouridine synthase [Gamsiella multidivaricata]|uniref:pseudouridine synthase n=1 Tax=Gamsiella multidivaricata TaxID=101098 RepID=UPI002220470F|nr:pseudouridine synthase [Gamsiella multidivaricata]KAG0368610.1 tRNA pseudouridine synthase 3 [Gamsiella multidivaricata]KAI7820326.1 pseudouridine synthase [Gamsiella multidivaricata]
MLLILFRRNPHSSLVSTASWVPSAHSHSFSTSSLIQAGKYIFYKRAFQNTERNNTPFLKQAYTNNIKELAANNAYHQDNNIMATNKDRPLIVQGKLSKAERKRRNKEGGSAAVLGSGSGAVDKYSTWSRDALLQRIRELEGAANGFSSETSTPIQESNGTIDNSDAVSSRPDSPAQGSSASTYSSIETPKRKDRRPFDFSKYAKRHVAFKVAYFGWPYGGFASQGMVDIKTVESELFNALLAARIIDDPSACNYSRCGRTDRGVSGLGQVVAMTVRSALPKNSPHVIRSEGDGFDPEAQNQDVGLTVEEREAKDGVYWKNGIKRNKDGSVFGELAYLNIINRLLPPDIRIIAWAPVPEDFNARFNCAWREYKYFFPKGFIDIERMRAGAVKFLGTHDFRNFCKYDASKTIENYDRTVFAISIDPVSEHEFPEKAGREFYQLTLRGSAFLWHQVRCMMAVLFSIGQGLEEPEIIDQMMDLKQCPAKPNYDMASDLPLVLYDCHFDNVEWQYQTEVDLVSDITPLRLYRAMEDKWSCYVTKSLMYSRMLQQLDQAMLYNLPEKGDKILLGEYVEQNATKENNISLGGDLRMFMGKKYAPLLQRQKCLPTEVKSRKHQEKKRLKMSLAESENNSADNSEMDSPRLPSTASLDSTSQLPSATESAAGSAGEAPST